MTETGRPTTATGTGGAGPTGTAAGPTAPGRRPPARLTARELVDVGIFATVYFVVVFAVAMLGIVSPLVMVLTLPLSPVVAGIPYLLFLTRVRRHGPVTLFGAVLAVLYLALGHPWQSTVLTVLVAALADAVLGAGGYRARWAAVAAHTVFSAWFIGPWIPLILDREAYLRSAGMTGMGSGYVEAFDALVSLPVLLAMLAATLVCGALGGLLGISLQHKHFRKAGLA